jgi:hypothetical protein
MHILTVILQSFSLAVVVSSPQGAGETTTIPLIGGIQWKQQQQRTNIGDE